MEQLWAPWRLSYVTKPPTPQVDDDCFICRSQNEQNDRENLLVSRTPDTVVMLNRYPYNNGHLLVAPCAHKAELANLSPAELTHGVEVVRDMVDILRELMRPEGFNVGLNLGKVAGAGLPGHMHWHIVPRWNGDTNYMTTVSDMRVIVQSLDALWVMLRERMGNQGG